MTEPTDGEEVEPGPCAWPISPVEVQNGKLRVDANGVFRDEHGRDIQLRGINTGGRSKWEPFVPFPISVEASVGAVKAAAEPFFARLHGWGLDTVRMPFSWEALEPTPDGFDERYLERYEAMVDVAWAHGLRVIIDFHQDVYASPFCGDGFPLWTIAGEYGPPRRDCENWGVGYIANLDVQAAFDRFWANADGLQDRYLRMWEVMAERLADHPGVLGLELINEPGWGSAPSIQAWKQSTLNPFHTAVIAHLRGVVGDEPLIFFNNTGIEAVGLTQTLHLRPEGEGLVYAPHMYDGGLITGSLALGHEPEPVVQSIAEFCRTSGVAGLIGEFGYHIAAVGGDLWLTRAMDSIDAWRLSATLWEYSHNETLWNHEDISVIDADGTERPVLDVYVRPWLRAVAGDNPEFAWDAEAGVGSAGWASDGGVSELVFPPRLFPAGPVQVELDTVSGPSGACYTFDPERAELRVYAPEGATVSLSFASP